MRWCGRVIGLTAFLTVFDRVATQAILLSLLKAHRVTPAAMGVAVNAQTIGMAVSGIAIASISGASEKRPGNPKGSGPAAEAKALAECVALLVLRSCQARQ